MCVDVGKAVNQIRYTRGSEACIRLHDAKSTAYWST